MAIDINDQPRRVYHDYDVTDYTGSENVPYIPPRRGIGAAEVLMFLVVVGLCVPLVTWLAMALARLFA